MHRSDLYYRLDSMSREQLLQLLPLYCDDSDPPKRFDYRGKVAYRISILLSEMENQTDEHTHPRTVAR